MELSALSSISADETLNQFAIIGSGPLPLTSLCILQALERRGCGPRCVYNIDNNPAAISESSKLCCRLGHGEDAMCFQCADAMRDTLNLGRFDVVYLAALVGTCYEQKINIIRNTVKTMRPGGASGASDSALAKKPLIPGTQLHRPETSVEGPLTSSRPSTYRRRCAR